MASVSQAPSDEYLPVITELTEYVRKVVIVNLSSDYSLAPRQYAAAALASAVNQF